MNIFTQIVFVIGRITPEHIQPLGTGFLISPNGLVVTTRHVVGDDDRGLCVLFPNIDNFDAYQDTTDRRADSITAKVKEVDPIRDLAILETTLQFPGPLPTISSFDNVSVGDTLAVFGYPHVIDGRRVLTYQNTILGAKVLLESQGVKSKHGIINTQARPGQSGSLVLDVRTATILGVLVGAYAPTAGGGIIIMNINPRELHQTTHCISAEYIRDMI
jgi:S1-C subfamily serine protease